MIEYPFCNSKGFDQRCDLKPQHLTDWTTWLDPSVNIYYLLTAVINVENKNVFFFMFFTSTIEEGCEKYAYCHTIQGAVDQFWLGFD